MKRKLLVLVLVLVWTGSVFGSTMRFSRRTDWGTLGNWNVFVNGSWISATALPTTADDLSYIANPTIAADTNAFAGWSPVGSGRTITINGSYTSGSRMSIGFGEGSIGTITVNAGGVLDTNGYDLYVSEANGIGVLNVYGTVYAGGVDILVGSAGSGTINVLSGGSVVSISRLTVGDRYPAGTGTAALIISPGGSFSCAANWNGKLDGAVADGRIRATPGGAIIVTNHTTDAGKTFTAILQPNTSDPYPAESDVITDTTPTLSWKSGNTGSYDVYFGTDINTIAPLSCDFNTDHIVDMADLLIFAQEWLTKPVAVVVDMKYFALLAGNWLATVDADYVGNQTENTYPITSPLTVGTTYYWRVDAIDANDQVHVGEVWRFSCGTTPMIELLTDPYFQHGFQVRSPAVTQGYEGILKWNDSWQQPTWNFGQLGSMTDINGVDAVLQPSGSYKWETPTKSIVIGPVNSTDADYRVMIDTQDEVIIPYIWWPAIMMVQDMPRCPWITDMSELWVNADVRLLSDEHWYDPNLQGGATHYDIAFILHDLNPASPGYGDIVWFGLGVYRSSNATRLEPGDWIMNGDIGPGGGGGKMIYKLGSEHFVAPDATLAGGEWVNFHGDLLPFVYDALEEAWSRGFLPNSHDPNNFKLSGFNAGMESLYRSKVELQIRNLSLKYVGITETPPNNTTGVGLTPTLRWPAGSDAASYDVYFGTSLSDVNNATHASAEFKGNQSGRMYGPGTLSILTTYYWRIDEVDNGGTTKGTVWSFTTGGRYTEKFEDITITNPGIWTDVDLGSYGVGANQVVEIGMRNSSVSYGRSAGVRTKGSSINRMLTLHGTWTAGGWDMTRMMVKTDANKKIQVYAGQTSDVHFYLVGIWNGGDYTERYDPLTIGTIGSWTDSADLSTYGVGANQVVEIVAAKNSLANYDAGVRAKGSALDRKLTLHLSSATGSDCLVMQAQADANSMVQVFKGDTSVNLVLLGYWTTAPGTYTEKFVDVGKPGSSATWTSRSLSSQGVPANAICEMLIANGSTANSNEIGVRRSGSSLERLFNLHVTSTASTVECGMMHVEADSSSNIEQYLQNADDAVNFHLLGYWN